MKEFPELFWSFPSHEPPFHSRSAICAYPWHITKRGQEACAFLPLCSLLAKFPTNTLKKSRRKQKFTLWIWSNKSTTIFDISVLEIAKFNFKNNFWIRSIWVPQNGVNCVCWKYLRKLAIQTLNRISSVVGLFVSIFRIQSAPANIQLKPIEYKAKRILYKI